MTEAEAWVQRLRTPTAYSSEVRQICGATNDGAREYLDGVFEVHTVKNLPSFLDMKLRARSTVQAKQCAEAIVAMIISQQEKFIAEPAVVQRQLIRQYQQDLQTEQQQLAAIINPELGRLGYLARLDKISWLRTRIGDLQETILLSLNPIRLTAPVYVTSKPVAPRRTLVLIMGVLLGLLVGVLYALIRESLSREK